MLDIKVYLNSLMAFLFTVLFVLLQLKGVDKRKSRAFGLFILNMIFWAAGVAMFYETSNKSQELFWSKFIYMAGGLIPPSFLYYSLIFKKEDIFKKRKIFYIYGPYLILFYLYFFTPLMIKSVFMQNGIKTFSYGPLHLIWEASFILVFSLSFLKFIELYKIYTGLTKEHIKYVLAGTLIGVILASVSNVIMPFFGRCDFVWLGPFLTSSWLFCITYTLLKHKIIDIRLAISNTVIFIGVYGLVLGIPFYFGYRYGLWQVSTWLMVVLATLGPIIYSILRRKVEDKILEEQKRYSETLDSISIGLNKYKTISEIVKHISYILQHNVGLNCVAFYLRHGDKLLLQSTKTNEDLFPKLINSVEFLVYLQKRIEPIIIHEIHHSDLLNLKGITDCLNEAKTEVIIPLVKSDQLEGVILLGEKKDGTFYSDKDTKVFNRLSDRTAVAIENIMYLEAAKRHDEEENRNKRQLQLDKFASSMAHQLKNPIHIGQNILEDVIYSVNKNEANIKEDQFTNISKGLINIKESFGRMSRIIETILSFGKGKFQLQQIKIEDILKDFDVLNKIILDKYRVKFTMDIDNSLPDIYADKGSVLEILTIYLDNSCQAVSQNVDVKSVDFRIYRPHPDLVRMEFTDNGYGMDEKTQKAIFDVSTSTKGTEGNGIGLITVRQRCNSIEGSKYGFKSDGRGYGSKFWVEFKKFAN